MHKFLNPALSFLFKGKKTRANIVVASKELEKFRTPDEARENSRSPVCKVRNLLKEISPYGFELDGSSSKANVARRETFAEFIEHEMD